MSKLLFTVLETFQCDANRVSVITDWTLIDESYRNGDVVELHRPDGSILNAESLLETKCTYDYSAPYANNYAFTFMDLKKEDVPPGTKAFQVVQHPPREIKHRKFEKIDKPGSIQEV